jgi:hypothetical protein
MLAFSALFFGVVLGMRFTVVAVGLAVGIALIVQLAAGSTLMEMALGSAGLQVGYLIGVVSRIGFRATFPLQDEHVIHARTERIDRWQAAH